MNTFYKINAPEVLQIPIKENHDQMIKLSGFYSDIDSEQYLRETVAKKLIKAQRSLPPGIYFKILEGYRSLSKQIELFNDYLLKLREQLPLLTNKQLHNKASLFIAPPVNHPPHSTGGVVDITLVNSQGIELNMGTDLTASYNESCYTDCKYISQQEKANRQILNSAMLAQGFVNYPAEWWHWSYGDRYWALLKNKPNAIFGSYK